MTLGQSIRSSSAWLFIGNTGSQVLAFLFGIVLARLLVPADFGILLTISIYTGIAGFIAGGGMGQPLVLAAYFKNVVLVFDRTCSVFEPGLLFDAHKLTLRFGADG